MPINETITVPFDLHRNFIGKGGAAVRQFMDDYKVTVRIPSQALRSDEIVISGFPANVKEAVAAIMHRVGQFEEQE